MNGTRSHRASALLLLAAIGCGSPLHTVTTFAGTGVEGDHDGPLLEATFSCPRGLALRPNGNLVIADYGNRRIREVQGGMVTEALDATFLLAAGGEGPSALAVNAKGQVAFVDGTLSAIFITSLEDESKDDGWGDFFDLEFEAFAGSLSSGHRDGSGLDAGFVRPTELAFDASDNLLVVDTGDHAIRRITPSGDVTTVWEVSPPAAPVALALLPDNGIIFEDSETAIRRLANGAIETIAPQLLDAGTVERFSSPNLSSLAVDPESGSIYVTLRYTVFRVDLDGGIVPIAGQEPPPGGGGGFRDGAADSALFASLAGIVVLPDGGGLLVADCGNNRIRLIR